MIRKLFGLVVVLFVLIVTSFAKQNTPQKQHTENESDRVNSRQAAVIEDSGSTNTPGYRLVVYASGRAEWALSRRRNSSLCLQSKGKLSPDLAQRFFQDLRALMPLSKLPVGHCAKSASFGNTLRVSYGNTESPDLSCPASGIETDKLLDDLSEINAALGVSKNVKGRPPACEQEPRKRTHKGKAKTVLSPSGYRHAELERG